MPAVKLQKFLGAAPKLAPEQLPDMAAQTASNVKLYSGDILPYRYPKVVGACYRSGTVQTIYPMYDKDDPSITYWLSWLTDVDVATAAALNSEQQRIYYTGDGKPKVTDFDLAISGGGPYPAASYDLGLPLPETEPSASATSFSTKTISSYARDSGNIATIVTSTDHGLKSGAVVTIHGFNDTSPDTTNFNVQNTTVTVVNSTTLTYYSSGSSVSTTSTDTDGRLSLAGGTVLRQYVYTWVTPWLEESLPSEPSDEIYIKEGQVVTVSSLPNSPPAGNNFIRGIRLYRTVTSNTGANYLRLRTIWFPVSTASASRTSNVVTITMGDYHNLMEGDRFKITGVAFGGTPDTSFDVTDVEVTEVIDNYTFTYTAAGSDKATTATSAGQLQFDVSEPGSTSGVYYTGTTFTDNYDVNGLLYLLESEDYDAPDEDMTGLISAHNNILVGFVDNEVCFSEPGKPWAWPQKYRKVFPERVVAVAAVSGYVLVMTDKYPYIIEGNTPEVMQSSRVETPYACTAKRGVATMQYGIVYPTNGGLAVFGVNGVQLVTKDLQDWDTWKAYTDPASLVAENYNDKYFASDGSRSFLFERNDEGGTYVTVPTGFSAAYYDAAQSSFYFVTGNLGVVYRWDDEAQPLASMEWKSKVIVTQEYINVGAARVVADYQVIDSETEAIIAFNAAVTEYNEDMFALVSQLGPLNGGISYVDPDSSGTVELTGALNTATVNGDPVLQNQIPVVGALPLSFRLWVEGQLIFETELTNSDIFRLPTGYRSDTFELSVAGSARVKAIHLGETPYGLRQS